MANTPDVELADAIAADINSTSRSWSMYFRAERAYKPLWIGEDELSDLQCLIVPWPIAEIEQKARDSVQETYSIDFGFAKRLNDKTRAEIDELRLLTDSVIRRYLYEPFTVANVGKFVPLRRLDEYVMFDPSRILRTKDGTSRYYSGDFLSVFRIPYRYLRDV